MGCFIGWDLFYSLVIPARPSRFPGVSRSLCWKGGWWWAPWRFHRVPCVGIDETQGFCISTAQTPEFQISPRQWLWESIQRGGGKNLGGFTYLPIPPFPPQLEFARLGRKWCSTFDSNTTQRLGMPLSNGMLVIYHHSRGNFLGIPSPWSQTFRWCTSAEAPLLAFVSERNYEPVWCPSCRIWLTTFLDRDTMKIYERGIGSCDICFLKNI